MLVKVLNMNLIVEHMIKSLEVRHLTTMLDS